MTVKEFFKSTTFKCIIVLLCVLLVSGVFLTVMNGLLEVTEEERFNRAIQKIYGKPVTMVEVEAVDYNDKATIEAAYLVEEDGNYLIKAKGTGGYEGGTVTCWVVVVIENGAVAGIDKVVIESNEGQSFIGNITDAFLNSFSETFVSGSEYDVNNFAKTGATRSASAICNAVNAAIDFANAMCGNVIKDIIKDNNFDYITNIDTRNTSFHVNENGTVTYSIKTNGYGNAGEFTISITVGTDGAITEYKIVTNGSTSGFDADMDDNIKNGTWFVGKNTQAILNGMGGSADYGNIQGGLNSNGLKTGATQSSYLCIQAAVFATSNYQRCIELGNIGEESNGGAENE